MRFVENLCFPQIKLLRRIYKESKKHHVRQRAHCILLSHQGVPVSKLAKIFGKTPRTIYTWFNLWEKYHFVGLYEKKGRGRKPKLSAEMRAKVRQWAKEFPKNLKKIAALVRENFGIRVSKRTIQRILHSLCFSWRRIRKKPKGEPDCEEYARKKEELEELKMEAEERLINLYYYDESGFCLEPYVPYAWQEKGETIEIESEQGKRFFVLGFLSREQGLSAYTVEGTVDSDVVIAAFDAFSENLERKTVVVMDHTSKAIKKKMPEWESKGLQIFYLPTYSPQLNLIEILWRFMKYEWIEWWAYKGWHYLVKYVEMVICGYQIEYEINFG